MERAISTLALLKVHPQERHNIPKDGACSLAIGRLRSNWGQPTAVVEEECAKLGYRQQ